MNKIAVLGSCLSAKVALVLKESGYFSIDSSLHHVRLDIFLKYIYDPASLGAPENIINHLIDKSIEVNNEKQHSQLCLRLNFQKSEKLSKFLNSIKTVDVLILDNQYDLSRSVVEYHHKDGNTYLFSNVNLNNLNVKKTNLGLMNEEATIDVYKVLFDFLLNINPRLRIIFLQYPISKYLGPKGYEEERVKRARRLAKKMTGLPGVTFPLIRMDKIHLEDKNYNHFTSKIYSLYANSIQKNLSSEKLPFDPSEEIQLADLERFCNGTISLAITKGKDNPYQDLPDRQFWKKAVAERYPLAIDQLYDCKFEINREHRVATCGSCFAQHIGRRMRMRGFNYLDVEKAPKALPENQHIANGFGIYSARYGNVYTSRQLLQLARRALGEFDFDEVWALPANEKGEIRYVDPFRPNLHPNGFDTPEQVLEEQRNHLAKVRELFASMEVFIFTMGLTECWYNKLTGAAYPIAPGVTAGEFDPAIHDFKNLSYEEIIFEMREFIDLLRSLNPNCKILLTVSPVPLTATADNTHVLVATMRSKSTLRAVTSSLYDQYDFVDYFPSYEVIMSHPFRGMFFQNNLRTIHEQGVDFVMSHFFAVHDVRGNQSDLTYAEGNEDFCDEVFLDLKNRKTQTFCAT